MRPYAAFSQQIPGEGSQEGTLWDRGVGVLLEVAGRYEGSGVHGEVTLQRKGRRRHAPGLGKSFIVCFHTAVKRALAAPNGPSWSANMKKVGVVGCGLMGAGIVEVCLKTGHPTVVREINQECLDRGLGRLNASMDRAVSKGKLSEADRDAAKGRLTATTELSDLSDCDIIIEAIIENRELKAGLWQEIAKVAKEGALLATNTSSIPLSSLAPSTGNPSRFLGLHFMNPVPVMKLVEIVEGIETSPETVAEGRAFLEGVGKTTILAKDTPGFVINVLLVPYLCDAVRLLEAGVATKEDIDKGMKLGCGMPMGPITLLDFVGLDTTLAISEVLHEEFGDPKYAAPPLLRRMVESGFMGKKCGRGFYDYGAKK